MVDAGSPESAVAASLHDDIVSIRANEETTANTCFDFIVLVIIIR